MPLPLASLVLIAIACLGAVLLVAEITCLWIVRDRSLREPATFPSFSVIKPLCGLDDELKENLESHLETDYPGPFEVLLGVRNEKDLAYPLAKAFADAHPDKVRLVLQQGEPGHNPKVNQLITLTREAKYEIIALTDSNVRVFPRYLQEHAAVLEDPKIGLSSHLFTGVGEQRLGAILDNLTLASFCAPNIAIGSVVMRLDQIVGKSIALRREVLAEVGGWHEVKDVLAEDQRLGSALRKMGLRTALCRTPVLNVQRTQSFAQFWGRHTRWAMIRFRVLMPGVLFEPLLNPFLFALAAALVAPRSPVAWTFALGAAVYSMAVTQVSAMLTRGHPFALTHMLLIPVRDLLLFFAWLRGSTKRWVTWRGTRLQVLSKTRLAAADALARAKNIHRLSR